MKKVNFNKSSIDYHDNWSEFRKLIDGTMDSLLFSWIESEYTYDVYADDNIFIRYVSVQKNDINAVSDFETNFKNLVQHKIRQSKNKALLVAQAPREGTEVIYASHNFCDPTSWFSDSVRSEDEVLMGSGSLFSGSHVNWICMNRGSVLDEEGWKEDVEHGYEVTIIADGIPLTQRDPLSNTGGDFIVNYESGSIEFVNSVYSPGAVTASYSYADGSTFYVKPYPYTKMDIEEVEAQFTKDVIINDSIIFGVFGNVEVFAPQYWEGNGGPFPTGYKVELKRQTYKSLFQLIDEALGSYPVVPAIGGQGRGFSSDMYGFPFRYGTVRTLYNSYGLEVRVWLQNHTPCDGERVSATFYCTVGEEA